METFCGLDNGSMHRLVCQGEGGGAGGGLMDLDLGMGRRNQRKDLCERKDDDQAEKE